MDTPIVKQGGEQMLQGQSCPPVTFEAKLRMRTDVVTEVTVWFVKNESTRLSCGAMRL